MASHLLNNPMQVRETIRAAIEEIMANNNRTGVIEDTSAIVGDLGFVSLDVAELIAVLEMELDVDPFTDGVSLMDVRTFGDFCTVYEKAYAARG